MVELFRGIITLSVYCFLALSTSIYVFCTMNNTSKTQSLDLIWLVERLKLQTSVIEEYKEQMNKSNGIMKICV